MRLADLICGPSSSPISATRRNHSTPDALVGCRDTWLAATFKRTYLGYAKFIFALGIKRLGRFLHLSGIRSGAELFCRQHQLSSFLGIAANILSCADTTYSDSSIHQRLIRQIINLGYDSRLHGVLFDMFRPHSPNAELINLFVMVPYTPPTDR